MVENDMCAEKFHDFIITFGGETLHESVGAALVADSVNNFAVFVIFFDHTVHGVYVVLKVGINGNRSVAMLLCFHEPGKKCVLVAAVAAELYSGENFVFPVRFANHLPRVVTGAVVHEKNSAFGRNKPVGNKALVFFGHDPNCFGQDFFLVITWDNSV